MKIVASPLARLPDQLRLGCPVYELTERYATFTGRESGFGLVHLLPYDLSAPSDQLGALFVRNMLLEKVFRRPSPSLA
jgi:hypothetical protein